jgi:hypothetical protein
MKRQTIQEKIHIEEKCLEKYKKKYRKTWKMTKKKINLRKIPKKNKTIQPIFVNEKNSKIIYCKI